MNKEETKKAIAVMQAFVDGEEIEFRDLSQRTWESVGNNQSISWHWVNNAYRIKPKVKKFKVALYRLAFGPTVYYPQHYAYAESSHNFIKWISPEMEYSEES